MALSKAGWTPFRGREVHGRAVRTYLRGTLIAEEGKPSGERGGEFIAGRGARPSLSSGGLSW
jgi:dihydroorotase